MINGVFRFSTCARIELTRWVFVAGCAMACGVLFGHSAAFAGCVFDETGFEKALQANSAADARQLQEMESRMVVIILLRKGKFNAEQDNLYFKYVAKETRAMLEKTINFEDFLEASETAKRLFSEGKCEEAEAKMRNALEKARAVSEGAVTGVLQFLHGEMEKNAAVGR